MKNNLLFGMLMLCALAASSQSWQWATGAGGTSYDIGNDVYADASGNSYVTGWYQNTVNFGPNTLTSNGTYDFFVAKYNSAGVCQWARGAGGSSNDVGYGVIADANGNVYVTGMFQGSVMFGTNTVNSGGFEDCFVAKYDASGTCLWAVSGGSNLDDQGQAITLDFQGNVIINGYFKNTATFGTSSVVSAGSSDVFTAKLNNSGVWQWVKRGGGTSGDNGYGVTSDANGNIYITGYYRNAAAFGTFNLSSAGTDDVYIVKYNSSGTEQWAATGGGASDDHGNGIVSDAAGNTYTTGWFKGGAASFGSNNLTASGSNEEVFITKYNSSGAPQWAKSAGSASYELGSGICLDNTSSPVICGSFQATITFGSTVLTSLGMSDIFVAKYSTAGVPQWCLAAGENGSDYPFKISSDAAGSIYTAGNFYNTCSFGTNNVTSNGIADIFVAKIDPAITDVNTTDGKVTCSIFPNPAAAIVTILVPSENARLVLYDCTGKMVLNTMITAGKFVLEKGELRSGMYFFTIETNSGAASGKLVFTD